MTEPAPAPATDRGAGFPFAALAVVVVWGGSFVAVRVALEAFTPLGLTALRLVLGALFLGAILRARGGPLLPRAGDRPLCALLGLVLALHLLIQAVGLQSTSAIHTGWIIGFSPAAIALGAQLFLRRPLPPLGWLGVLVATAGVLVVTLDELPDFADARVGDLLQLTSCFTWALYTLVALGPVVRSGVLSVSFFAMAVAALTLLAVAGSTGFASVDAADVSGRAWGALLYLGLLCSGVAYAVWFQAQRAYGPHRVGATLYFEPFATLVFAVLILDEPVTGRALLGGMIVIAGVVLIARGARLRATPD